METVCAAKTEKGTGLPSAAEFHFELDGASREELNAIAILSRRISGTSAVDLKEIELSTLRATDRDGKSVLSHLVELTSSDKASLAGASFNLSVDLKEERRRVAIAETLIEGLSGLGRSTQENHGTCGPETISLLVNAIAPGRWTALVRDLLEKGAHGANIRVPEDINEPDQSPNRSERDRVIQAAIKVACAPEHGAQYSNQRDAFIGSDGADLGSGINTVDAARVLTKLLSTPPTQYSAISDPEQIAALCKSTKEPIYVTIRWSADPASEHSLHALAVTGVDAEGRVHFRNPWGPDVKGAELSDPPRRVENPETGEESMRFEDFVARIHDAAIPSTFLVA